jgi:hypothetical protein
LISTPLGGLSVNNTHVEVFPDVRATILNRIFELPVANDGQPIPALCETTVPTVASEIARAHGGTLTADFLSGRTRFAFRMPIN